MSRYTPIGREGNEQLRVYKPRTHAPKTNAPVNTGIHAQNTEEIENPHAFVSPGMPRSILPYRGYTTDAQGREIHRQGNKRVVIEKRRKVGRRVHWSLFLGLGMLGTIGAFVLGGWVVNAIQENNINAQYQFPRFYQTDAVVGHDDSAQHPSHFVLENLHGNVIIIELPGGQAKNAWIYQGPPIFTANGLDPQIPVTAEFKDVNSDSKIDMIVHVGNSTIVYLNNGTKFVAQK